MRILTYKRTHTGDPSNAGVFGVNDCMGSVRALQYDAVIGIGGIGSEPRSNQIDGKITWVGVSPKKRMGQWHNPLVTFERFVLFDSAGPALASIGPNLAKRMYQGKVRYLLKGYSKVEKSDAEEIVSWVLAATHDVVGIQIKVHENIRVRCVCKPSGKVAALTPDRPKRNPPC